MAVQPKKIVIVGGSLAGLLAGLVLKRLGHDVRILERSPSSQLQTQGTGIVFGPQVQEYFDRFIRMRETYTVRSYRRQTVDGAGKSIPELEEQIVQQMVSWDLVYFVLRGEFDGLASGYLQRVEKWGDEGQGKGTYEYGCVAVGIRDKGEKVELEFVDREGQAQVLEADMVIGADGPSSTIRKILLPEVERKHAGYVAWRGTMLENEATNELKEMVTDRLPYYFNNTEGTHIVAYLIPGQDGTLEPGSRLINWVWYCNYRPDSKEYQDLMTDSSGRTHRLTMPAGKVQPQLWTQQKAYAAKVLPPQFSELVAGTKAPFVQAITDALSPQASFFNHKVLLVGDALAGFRPHATASMSQAAMHALLLERMMRGKLSWEEMCELMMKYARRVSEAGIKMGEKSQFKGQGGGKGWFAISQAK